MKNEKQCKADKASLSTLSFGKVPSKKCGFPWNSLK